MNPILDIRNLTKRYAGKPAVSGLNLTVHPGDLFGFIGHNGAGKTTTIRCAVGVLDFDEGEIFIDGHSVKTDPILCKSLTAYVPDSPDLYEYLTGIQYLNFIGDVYAVESRVREARIRNYGDLLGMTGNLGTLISAYSHGMKQKVALIGALMHQPRLLVLDEPFVGLDPQAAFDIKNIMKSLCNEGSAIFFSTHVLDVAEKLCNKVAIIKGGQLIVSGDTETVRGQASLEERFLEVTRSDA